MELQDCSTPMVLLQNLPYPERVIRRFLQKIDFTSSQDECWLFTDKPTGAGYAQFYVSPDNRRMLAHRFAFTIQYGPIPEGALVLHKPPCINKMCVRHLYTGTYEQNEADKRLLNRHAHGLRHGSKTHPERVPRGDTHPMHNNPAYASRGEKQHLAKLTEEMVRAIRAEYIAGVTKTELGKRYGVCRPTIAQVVTYTTWRHVL